MNKDMDERVLPSGQYRDANNIQIATSDGSDVGSLQSLLANANMVDGSVDPQYATCVGVLNLPEKDLIYYFVSGGGAFTTTSYSSTQNDSRSGHGPSIKKDYIIEYDTKKETYKYVFVDIYEARATVSENQAASGNVIRVAIGDSNTINKTGIRIGMELSHGQLNDPNSNAVNYVGGTDIVVTDIQYESAFGSDPECWKIILNKNVPYSSTGDIMTFKAKRVLSFNPTNYITAINHIDGMLFWTDNATEPKKINIKRSLYGTGGVLPLAGGTITGYNSGNPTDSYAQNWANNNADFHTRLVTQKADGFYRVCRNPAGDRAIWCREDHITVIKKSPTQPLRLEMSTTEADRTPTSGTPNNTFASANINFSGGGQNGLLELGDTITVTFNTNVDYREGDVIVAVQDSNNVNPSLFSNDIAEVRMICTDDNGATGNAPDLITSGPFEFEILSLNQELPASSILYHTKLEKAKALFEYKFVRFSYRWKYEDGEYSCFAPWSEIAFIPGDFDYLPQKGFNLGMKNQLRALKLVDYFGEPSAVPEDVVGVDLLYKETNNQTVYTVKDIKESDGAPLWQDWKNNWRARGEFEIKSEMIHAVVPSNQLLRQWDNVPRKALAQEISGNRLIYGNYLQNYTVIDAPEISVTMSSQTINNDDDQDLQYATKSLKSLRTYQVGVTFLDEYGRETPVLASKTGGSITVDKAGAPKANRIQVKLTTDPPTWAKYFKYWIKETSNEYYNLAMDRFYAAEDGNVWLSFPSSERNKVDEESFLIMKKQHDNNVFVPDAARYKILAIENEAPLFVKTQKKSMGIHSGTFGSGGGNAGQPIFNAIYIDVAQAAFHTAFGVTDGATTTSLLIGENDLYLKIRQGVISSEWYKITGLTRPNNNVYRITVIKPFEADMYFTQNSTATPPDPTDPMNTGLSMEIIQEVVVNKPEYEGRFFAKIYKDLVLDQNLLANQDVNINWVVTQSQAIQRIRDWSQKESNHKTTWRNADGCRGRRGFFLDESSVMGGPGYTGGDVAGGSHGDWEDAWGNWDRSNVVGCWGASNGDDTNNSWELTMTNTTTHSAGYRRFPNYSDWDYSTGNDNGGPASAYGGEHPTGMGLHSSGANTSTPASEVDCMHLSYSNIAPSGDNANNAYWAPNQSGTNVSAAEREWIRTMCTVGTTFRWEGDTTVYEVIGNTRGQAPPPIGGAHPSNTNWAAKLENFDNQTGGDGNQYNEAGNKRTRYFIRFRPSMGFSTGNTVDYQPGGFIGDQPITQYDPRTHDAQGNPNWWNSTWDVNGSGGEKRTIQIVENFVTEEIAAEFTSTNPAIWETEPKEDVGLDIYYEASRAIPIDYDHTTNEQLVPIGSWFMIGTSGPYYVTAWNDDVMSFSPAATVPTQDTNQLFFRIYDGSMVMPRINQNGGIAVGDTTCRISQGRSPIGWNGGNRSSHATHHCTFRLGWHNCWSYGNGVESDRIRDDFNAAQIDNGVKASTTLAEQYKEERRSSGMIFSGIFNSISGINRLNQFIQAEPITKDINPVYGTIQKLFTRNTDTLTFCEDKVLRVLTNKDALFNADGNSNVTSNQMVLGQAVPIDGDVGISTNPESFAATPAGIYFADQMRGQVGYLQGSGINIISDFGMKDYFNDNMQDLSDIMGTYDDKKNEYNITLGKKNHRSQVRSTKTTLSFNEKTKGWVSFKSFGPEAGTSLNNEYYTWDKGLLWQHHRETDKDGNALTVNNFYGTQYYSDVTLIFNDQPGSVKSFNLLNYEGTEPAITPFVDYNVTNASGQTLSNLNDSEYYNLWTKTGWYVEDLKTNLQDARNLEFKDKEGKFFSTVQGVTTSLDNLDEREFSVQGLGSATMESTGTPVTQHKLQVRPNNLSSGGTNWDSTADSSDWNVTNVSSTVQTSASTIPAGYRDSTLHNMTIGGNLYSGLDLDAKNFSVPGGTATTATVNGVLTYTYTAASGWNADSEVTKVEFTDNGIPGDPGNTVNCRIHYGSFTMPAAQKNIYADVDHVATPRGGGVILREACVRMTFEESSSPNDNVSIVMSNVNGTSLGTVDITETNPDTTNPFTTTTAFAGSVSRHSGLVEEGQTTILAQYTVTADSGYYLTKKGPNQNGVHAYYWSNLANGAWQPYYNINVVDNYYTSSGNTNKIQSSVVTVEYTPPMVAPLYPDPQSGEQGFCAHLHRVHMDYLARPISGTNPDPKLNSLTFSGGHITGETGVNTIVKGNISTPITIGLNSGTAGQFNLQVGELDTSGDNPTISSSYNFDTATFSDGTNYSKVITMPSTGYATQSVNLPVIADNTADKYYSVIASTTSGGDEGTVHLTFDSSIPDAANEKNILQRSNRSAVIQAPTVGNFVNGSSNTTIASKFPGSTSEIVHSVTFTLSDSRGGENVATKARDVVATDFNGWFEQKACNMVKGSTTMTVPNITGLSVGQSVYLPDNLETFKGTTIESITNSTTIVLSEALTADSFTAAQVAFGSSWNFNIDNIVTTQTSANLVTVTADVTCTKYGYTSANCNLDLSKGFIT